MSSIIDFYRDEHVLITGGTGFVGKLLISKLLLSCPDIKKITLLVRRKKEENMNNKFQSLFNNVIFSKLKKKMPMFHEKITFIEGDCELKQLGLSQIDKFEITQNVTIVFHCAANVEFNNNLRKEVNINVYGAIEIINLAKYVRNLKVLVYVSSSYSNCHLPVVEEKYCKPEINYKTLMKLADKKHLTINDRYVLGDVANTYFYTKAAAEQAIIEEGKSLPIAIFRPSAIVSTWKEPIPGWTDKAFAPTALVKNLILGYYSPVLCSNDLIIDMVPGDFTVNALISVAWDTHERYSNKTLTEPRIYNYVSMSDNVLKFKTFLNKVSDMLHQKPSEHAIWYPIIDIHKTKLRNKIPSLIRPWLLVLIIESWNHILGNKKSKNRYFKGGQMYEILMDISDYLIRRPHIYFNDNIRELWHNMNELDQKMFLFDMKKLDWDNYLKVYYNGIMSFLIKEENWNEKRAQRHFMKLRTIHITVKALLYTCGLYVFYFIFIKLFLYLFLSY